MTKTFDVIVVGAALNGLAAGLALGGHRARRPLSVAIIDRKDPRQDLSSDNDARASAITASSKRMFEALGVWEHVAPHMQAMGEIIVTDGRGPEARPVLLQFGEAECGAGLIGLHGGEPPFAAVAFLMPLKNHPTSRW